MLVVQMRTVMVQIEYMHDHQQRWDVILKAPILVREFSCADAISHRDHDANKN